MGRFFGVMALGRSHGCSAPRRSSPRSRRRSESSRSARKSTAPGRATCFACSGNIVVLADPLKADIKAYDMETKAALGSCGMPSDFKRGALFARGTLCRSSTRPSEARSRSRELRLSARDAARRSAPTTPRGWLPSASARRQPHHRRAATPVERGWPLTVRAAAFELLSVRELERDAAGNRYVLQKCCSRRTRHTPERSASRSPCSATIRAAGSTAPTGCHSRTARSAPSTTWRCCPGETLSSRSMTRPRTSSGSTASRCLMLRARRKASFRRMCRMRPRRTVSKWRPKRSPPAISPGRRRSPTPSRAARQRARSYRRAADLRSSPKRASIWTRLGTIIPRRRR